MRCFYSAIYYDVSTMEPVKYREGDVALTFKTSSKTAIANSRSMYNAILALSYCIYITIKTPFDIEVVNHILSSHSHEHKKLLVNFKRPVGCIQHLFLFIN